jgi:hypothetical protein
LTVNGGIVQNQASNSNVDVQYAQRASQPVNDALAQQQFGNNGMVGNASNTLRILLKSEQIDALVTQYQVSSIARGTVKLDLLARDRESVDARAGADRARRVAGATQAGEATGRGAEVPAERTLEEQARGVTTPPLAAAVNQPGANQAGANQALVNQAAANQGSANQAALHQTGEQAASRQQTLTGGNLTDGSNRWTTGPAGAPAAAPGWLEVLVTIEPPPATGAGRQAE